MTEPPWLATQDQLSSPAVTLLLLLRPREAVNIGAMVRYKHEVSKITHDELGFILCPDRALERLKRRFRCYVRQWREFRWIKKEGLRTNLWKLFAHRFLARSAYQRMKRNSIPEQRPPACESSLPR